MVGKPEDRRRRIDLEVSNSGRRHGIGEHVIRLIGAGIPRSVPGSALPALLVE
jgi:hypothetical protein